MKLQSDIGRKLTQISREAEERDAKRRAEKLNLPYLDLRESPLDVDVLALISAETAKGARLAVIDRQKSNLLKVVAYDPESVEAKKILNELRDNKFNLEIAISSLTGLEHVWSFYQFVHKASNQITGRVAINEENLQNFKSKAKTVSAAVNEIKIANESIMGAGDLLEIFLAAALALAASDIHLEAGREASKFRLRIDGLLHDLFSEINLDDYHLLLSRIKLLSGLKLNVHDISQDGRFTIKDGHEIEIRVSVLPSEYGETVVLRLLDPETIQLELSDLGLRSDDLELVQAELAKPNGMILNTGPTGSGKTTTLYAFLLHVNNPELKIITIENPIEYRLEGIEQTQIDEESGYTFENGLQAIVRQDPDVVLVGEIRNKETAEIAMHASLTGHLVFSTLHTNDSFGTIPRLIDLGVRPSVLGPALNLIIAQRLVRRLCDFCKKSLSETSELTKHLDEFFAHLNQRVNREAYKDIKLYEAIGCEKCGQIGYKGRIAIFEFLRVDDAVGDVIYKDPSELAIKEAAKKQGIISLQEDGILKVITGTTTFEEVVRITGSISWYVSKKNEAEKPL